MKMMTYWIKCIKCGEIFMLDLDGDKVEHWRNGGGNIQDIFPELSPEDRELLVSQICEKCWDDMFGKEV